MDMKSPFSSFRTRLPNFPELFERLRSFFSRRPAKKHPWFWSISAFILFLILYFISSLSTLRIFLPHFHEITGFPFGEKNYLIVFQNNNELRPAGGFISSYGILKFSHGFYDGITIADVYGDIAKHPYLKPPYPMEQLLADPNYQGYSFRDANYDPDYPKSAQELVRMLHLTQPNLEIDGVVAVNYTFLEDLLEALGPVTIVLDNKSENRPVTFTKDNLFETLENAVNDIDQHDLTQLQNRKSALKFLADALLKKMFWNPLKLRKVSDAIVHNLTLKNIQFYFNAPSLQKIANNYAWAGAWPAILEGDFLAVNEANLGGMKSDRYLQRKITYHLKLEPDQENGHFQLIGEVTIDLYHFGIENIPLSGNYKGFFRTYVPRGAKLLEVAPSYRKDVWEKDEELFHVFGNIVNLKPGEKTQLFYRYALPEVLVHGNDYHLSIPKQSGTSQDDYTIIVEAPQGYRIDSSSFIPHENIGIYERALQTDLDLDLTLLPDKNPPFVIYQQIEEVGRAALQIPGQTQAGSSENPGDGPGPGFTKIAIVFNEAIANKNSEDSLNYTVEDSDQKHPEHHDELNIDHIQHNGKRVVLFVRGMTKQPGEFYTLTLKNIEDLHGNILDPNPRKVTVVQK